MSIIFWMGVTRNIELKSVEAWSSFWSWMETLLIEMNVDTDTSLALGMVSQIVKISAPMREKPI